MGDDERPAGVDPRDQEVGDDRVGRADGREADQGEEADGQGGEVEVIGQLEGQRRPVRGEHGHLQEGDKGLLDQQRMR